MNSQEFFLWEQRSQDTIDVKRCYIDIAGDIVTGLLLSQLIYWYLPSKGGDTKLRVEIGGELWLAKGRADWWEECRISAKQYDRSAEILKGLGLIETRVKKFNGSPTSHIKLNLCKLLELLSALGGGNNVITQKAITLLPKRQYRCSPKGNNVIAETGISLTESTSETTQRKHQSPEPSSLFFEKDKLVGARKLMENDSAFARARRARKKDAKTAETDEQGRAPSFS